MNVHSILNTEIFIRQLTSMLDSSYPDKNEKVVRCSKRIAEEMNKIGSEVPHTLFAKSAALSEATSDPRAIDAPIVSGIAQDILGILRELREPASKAVVPSVESVQHDAYLRRPDVVKILDAHPPEALSSVEALPGLTAQAKKLAHRILDGVYGDEVRERFCNGLISPEDLFFLLLADGAHHGDKLDKVELCKSRLSKRDLLKLRYLKGVLTPEKIADVMTGKIAKDGLLGGLRLTKAVAATYLVDHATALMAYMNCFYRPTLNQLLHIALESKDPDVRASLRQAVRESDPKTWESLEQLLAIFDEQDDEEAIKIAHNLRFDPAFCHFLSTITLSRPKLVLSLAESFFDSTKKEVKKIDLEIMERLLSGYGEAVKKSILDAASHGGVERARELFTNLQGSSARNLARAAFVEAFSKSHPEDALGMILSCYDNKESPCPIFMNVNPADLFEEYIEDKAVDEALAFWPNVQPHRQASIDFLATLLIRATQQNRDGAVELFKRILGMTKNKKVVVGALEKLANHLGSVADTVGVIPFIKFLSPKYGDIVRKHFIMGAQAYEGEIGTRDMIAILRTVRTPAFIPELCHTLFFEMGLPLTVSQKTDIDALLEEPLEKNDRDRVLTLLAKAYASTGDAPEIREAFQLLSKIHKKGALGDALTLVMKALFESELDTASKARYGRKMLVLAQSLDTGTQDVIRVSLVNLLSRSTDTKMAFDIVKGIDSDKLVAIALAEFAKALVELRPDGYEAHLQSLVSIADDRACVQAALGPVAKWDQTLATKLLEYVSVENMDAARSIVEQFARESSDSDSE